jgi:hypothetical protein
MFLCIQECLLKIERYIDQLSTLGDEYVPPDVTADA